jgi:hypothetical protein
LLPIPVCCLHAALFLEFLLTAKGNALAETMMMTL